MAKTTKVLSQGDADQLFYGEEIIVRHGIAKGDFGSSSADRNERSTYSAPFGMAILSHDIQWSGHHSSASHVETRQAGQLTYETGVLARLMEAVTDGFLKGSLDYKGKKIIGADAAGKFSEFQREFQANYRFAADTNAKVTFKWTTNTKNGRHGAKIKAHANIRLLKMGTAEQAQQAIDVIKFVMKTGESKDIFELINKVLTGKEGKTDAVPDPVSKPTQPDVKDDVDKPKPKPKSAPPKDGKIEP